MTTAIIELNDAGVLARVNGKMLPDSPGFALIDGNNLLVGREAFANARIKPRHVENRFWDELSLDPLTGANGATRNHADLAFAHLNSIVSQLGGDKPEAVLCVPGSFTRQQLGLLLGIAREARLQVVGLIDSAVAACNLPAGSGRVLHLDAQLHRIVLTELEAGQSLTRVGVYEMNRFGLIALRETWANVIADAFVRSTRFDPMHGAESEQQLYDQLPVWLESLHDNSDAPLNLGPAAGSHSVSVKPERLARASADQYQQILQLILGRTRPGDKVTVLLSHRFGCFPGFRDTLAQLADATLVELDAGQAAAGAERHLDFLRSTGDEALGYVTSVPLTRGQAGADAGAGPAGARPTHVVYGSRAYAIGVKPLVVGAAVPETTAGFSVRGPAPGVSRQHFSLTADNDGVLLKDLSTYGTLVNGQPVSDQVRLQAGDTITVGSPGMSLSLVAAVDVHGA